MTGIVDIGGMESHYIVHLQTTLLRDTAHSHITFCLTLLYLVHITIYGVCSQLIIPYACMNSCMHTVT